MLLDKIILLLEKLLVFLKAKQAKRNKTDLSDSETKLIDSSNIKKISETELKQKLITKPSIFSEIIPELDLETSLQLFEEIEPGDIVYAPTCTNVGKVSGLPINHRMRPFIVAKKTKDGVSGFNGTSNLEKRFNSSFCLSSDRYDGIGKTGTINLQKFWYFEKQDIISKIGTLNTHDVIEINKIILSARERGNACPLIDKKIKIKPGMIISDGSLFFVYETNESQKTMSVYKLTKGNTNIVFSFNDIAYQIKDKKNPPILLTITNNFQILSTCNLGVLKELKKINSKRIEKENRQSKTDKEKIEKHRFAYPLGQTFNLGGNEYLYLFSNENIDYGVEIIDESEISPVMSLEKCKEYFTKNKILKREEVLEILESIAAQNKKFNWLVSYAYNKYDEESFCEKI